MALAHGRAELEEDIERSATGEFSGRVDAERAEVVGNAFADVRQALEAGRVGCRGVFHEEGRVE